MRMTSQCFCMYSTSGLAGCMVDVVHAVADLGVLVGDLAGPQALVDRLPGLAAVVGAEGAGRGDRDVDPVGVGRVLDDRVQAHAARARLPLRAGVVLAQAGQLGPRLRRRRWT